MGDLLGQFVHAQAYFAVHIVFAGLALANGYDQQAAGSTQVEKLADRFVAFAIMSVLNEDERTAVLDGLIHDGLFLRMNERGDEYAAVVDGLFVKHLPCLPFSGGDFRAEPHGFHVGTAKQEYVADEPSEADGVFEVFLHPDYEMNMVGHDGSVGDLGLRMQAVEGPDLVAEDKADGGVIEERAGGSGPHGGEGEAVRASLGRAGSFMVVLPEFS